MDDAAGLTQELFVKKVLEELTRWIRQANSESRWRNRILHIIPLLFLKIFVLSSDTAGFMLTYFNPTNNSISLNIKVQTDWLIHCFNLLLDQVRECHIAFMYHWLNHNEDRRQVWHRYEESQ